MRSSPVFAVILAASSCGCSQKPEFRRLAMNPQRAPECEEEREFWRRTLERGEAVDADLDHAIGLMVKHRTLEDTVTRARHYGDIARDALALFPASSMKEALEEAVEFCISRTH